MTSQQIMLALIILLGVAVFVAVFALLNHMTKNKVISSSMQSFIDYTESESTKRSAAKNEQIALDGELDESTFDMLTKLDNVIQQSNIRKFIPFLNAELYLIALILVLALAIIISQQVTGKIAIGLFFGAAFAFVTMASLLVAKNVNYNRVEDEIVDFINLMENFSKTSGDIIDIFGKVYPYLTEPLRSITQRCYVSGIKTGNINSALSEFERSVGHKKFREVIHNLNVCSRYDTNYSDIITDSRQMLHEYLSGKEQKKAMLREARIEYVMIAAIAMVLFYMMGEFMEVDLRHLLFNTLIGNFFGFYTVGVIGLAIISLFILENGKD